MKQQLEVLQQLPCAFSLRLYYAFTHVECTHANGGRKGSVEWTRISIYRAASLNDPVLQVGWVCMHLSLFRSTDGNVFFLISWCMQLLYGKRVWLMLPLPVDAIVLTGMSTDCSDLITKTLSHKTGVALWLLLSGVFMSFCVWTSILSTPVKLRCLHYITACTLTNLYINYTP